MTAKFAKMWDFSDILFEVEGKEVHANKAVLGMWSDVFKAMFGGHFNERDMMIVKLPGKKYEDFLNLMTLLHPPWKELDECQIEGLLPLIQEYQIEVLHHKVDDFLCDQAASVKSFVLSERYNLIKTREYCLQFLKRAPLDRLKHQPMYELLDQTFLLELMAEKINKYEKNIENLREVRMVLERKKPTTFPGMTLLCNNCHSARDQQVDCSQCLLSCCQKLTLLLRDIDS